MATPEGRADSSSQMSGHGWQERGACLEQMDRAERLEVEEQMPVQSVMRKKAQEFFQTCDAEGKGFIARTDMQVRGVSTSSFT